MVKLKEVGWASAQPLKPAQLQDPVSPSTPVTHTPVSDAEGCKLVAETVKGLDETLKAMKHKPSKETGPSVVEPMEVP